MLRLTSGLDVLHSASRPIGNRPSRSAACAFAIAGLISLAALTCPLRAQQPALAPPARAAIVSVLPMPAASNSAAVLRSSLPIKATARHTSLIVIGFMGGHVHADNFVHKEARLAEQLREQYPGNIHASVFANRDSSRALASILHLLDTNKDGALSTEEKQAARIVIYGHSWGASETVNLASRLNTLHIPVLLTIQVDSVQKSREDDRRIPSNVQQAINFYQRDGFLHGRRAIEAIDPAQTTILGSYESGYHAHPVACPGYPWFARTFMKPHIEIENDPALWNQIAALIQARVL